LGGNIHTIRKNLKIVSKETGLEVNAEKVYGHVSISECRTKWEHAVR
jgi:hypothetical protein